MLFRYCLNDFQMVPGASIITGIIFVLHSIFAVFLLYDFYILEKI